MLSPPIVVRLIVGMTGRGVRCSVMRATAVHADRQRAVHDTRVQLSRLRQTNGEPDREDTGQTAKESTMTHGSNI